jgi:hypothetical protein
MSWTIYKINILNSFIGQRFSNDMDGFANFIADEYDSAIKRGGDMIYGVPVLNGNVVGMAKEIKRALKKGVDSDGENFNILAEIYPSAFDAYWLGAEMAPIPNPLLRPLGWQSTPPAPGAIMNIGPNPIQLAASAAIHKAIKEAVEALVDELKSATVTIPLLGEFIIYDTIDKILKNEPVPTELKNHPLVKAGMEIVRELKQAKKKKPSCGSQFKPSIKFPFPELPKKKEIIEKARKKLLDEAVEEIKKSLIAAAEEIILQPILQQIEMVVAVANNIPKKPTKEELKKMVKDTIDGLVPEIDLPGIDIPKLPTKEEFKEMVEDSIPTKEELLAMAYDLIKGLIPDIPNIWFIPPTIVFTEPTNIFLNPFVQLAKFHLMGVSGTMSVIAQYPPPAPPAPAILNWSGYTVIG